MRRDHSAERQQIVLVAARTMQQQERRGRGLCRRLEAMNE
jgi:hypothetical protein